MSDTGPGEGTLRVCPLLQHATAYTILRPFFDLERETATLNLDATLPGSIPAACQEYSSKTHPHLFPSSNSSAMVSIPRVNPGDYVAWHCDTIHSVDAVHNGPSDSSVMYIPACALTKGNVDFLERQREASGTWGVPPDFPGYGTGAGEGELEGKVDWDVVGEEGKKAMGLNRGRGFEGWEARNEMSEGEKEAVEYGNRVLFL